MPIKEVSRLNTPCYFETWQTRHPTPFNLPQTQLCSSSRLGDASAIILILLEIEISTILSIRLAFLLGTFVVEIRYHTVKIKGADIFNDTLPISVAHMDRSFKCLRRNNKMPQGSGLVLNLLVLSDAGLLAT